MPQQWTGRWQPQLSGTGAYAPTTGSRNRTWDTLEYLRKMQPPKTTPLPTRYPSEQMYRGQVEYYKRRLQAGEKPEDLVKEITATQEQKAKAEQALYSQQLEWGKAYGAAAREVEKETQWEREFGRKERGTEVAEAREKRLVGAQTWREAADAKKQEALEYDRAGRLAQSQGRLDLAKQNFTLRDNADKRAQDFFDWEKEGRPFDERLRDIDIEKGEIAIQKGWKDLQEQPYGAADEPSLYQLHKDIRAAAIQGAAREAKAQAEANILKANPSARLSFGYQDKVEIEAARIFPEIYKAVYDKVFEEYTTVVPGAGAELRRRRGKRIAPGGADTGGYPPVTGVPAPKTSWEPPPEGDGEFPPEADAALSELEGWEKTTGTTKYRGY